MDAAEPYRAMAVVGPPQFGNRLVGVGIHQTLLGVRGKTDR